MKIEVKTTIARPIHEVWTLLADDFTGIANWSESVFTSTQLDDIASRDGSPMAGRYCTFTDDPNGFGAREEITKYDADNYELQFDVEPHNAPAALPIKRNYVTVNLRALGPSSTELRWLVTPTLKAHGYVMYPMLKLGLAKSFKGLLAEFKKHAEADPSQRAEMAPSLAAVG